MASTAPSGTARRARRRKLARALSRRLGGLPPALAALLATAAPFATAGAADVPLTVREAAGLGASGRAVEAVVPFAEGERDDLAGLAVVDAAGDLVPAQLAVMNRRAARDGSVRHASVLFEADVGAYTGAPGSGTAVYRLTAGANPAPATPATVVDEGARLVVDTGAARVSIARSPFSIRLPTGPIEIDLVGADGARRPTLGRDDVTVEIEESGPLRVRLKASAPTRTRADGTLLHGWALRLEALAGRSTLALDFQLVNAALDRARSGPLYLESLEIAVPGDGPARAAEVRALPGPAPDPDPPAAALASGSVGLAARRFHESWPHGLRREASGRLVAAPFPAWSETQVGPADGPLRPNGTGLHWLEDMQATIVELLIDVGVRDAAAFAREARAFEHPPAVSVPLARHREARSLPGFGGRLRASIEGAPDRGGPRAPVYPVANGAFWVDALGGSFLTGRDEFLHAPQRKRDPRTAGGWPDVGADFLVTGDPVDLAVALDRARGELNVPAQWLPGYVRARDGARLGLTENPYPPVSWRRFDGNGTSPWRLPYLPGTAPDGPPRDDQHGWFHHVEQAWLMSADPWLRDWYGFVAEFRRGRLAGDDPYPDLSGRAVGHALGHALQAHRVTGDRELLALVGDYVEAELAPRVNALGAWTGSGDGRTAAWQTGYLLRALIEYLDELPGTGPPLTRDAAAAGIVRDAIAWNVEVGRFGDWRDAASAAPGRSSGTGLTLVDPQRWFAEQPHADPADAALARRAAAQLDDYLDGGIDGPDGAGEPPYGDFDGWGGGFEGRLHPAPARADAAPGLRLLVPAGGAAPD